MTNEQVNTPTDITLGDFIVPKHKRTVKKGMKSEKKMEIVPARHVPSELLGHDEEEEKLPDFVDTDDEEECCKHRHGEGTPKPVPVRHTVDEISKTSVEVDRLLANIEDMKKALDPDS